MITKTAKKTDTDSDRDGLKNENARQIHFIHDNTQHTHDTCVHDRFVLIRKFWLVKQLWFKKTMQMNACVSHWNNMSMYCIWYRTYLLL